MVDISLADFCAISMAATFVIALLGAIFPFIMRKTNRFPNFLAYANAFSGGIVLGGGFLHMMPDAIEMWEHYGEVEFPIPYLLMSGSALLLFLIEKIFIEDSELHAHPDGHHHHHHDVGTEKAPLIHDHTTINKQADGEETIQDQENNKGVHPMSAMLFVFALGIHSALEGLGIGSAETIGSSILLFLAVFLHKFFEALVLGIQVANARFRASKRMTIIIQSSLIFVYSLLTPLGILIGLLAQSSTEGSTSTMVSSVLTALAAGSFIYIGVFEILPQSFASKNKIIIKSILALIGWAFMSGMAALEIDDDGHHHH